MGQSTLVVQSTSVVTPWPQVHGLLPGLWILERKNLIWVQKNYNNSWKKYHFVVPYGRVFRGKEKALDIIYFELVMTSMSETTNILDKYVDRYVCIVNYHLVMIVACCLSNFGQNMD
jgi:hypothetical protein